MRKIWNWAWGIYRKYQEGIDYLFWGGVAFVLSMVLFYIFANMMMMDEQIANVITWIICVIFTYITNRTFVFKSKTSGVKAVTKEFVDFIQNVSGESCVYLPATIKNRWKKFRADQKMKEIEYDAKAAAKRAEAKEKKNKKKNK